MDTLTAPGAAVEAAELDTIRTRLEADLPAFLADLERLVNIDCGSYTPAGVNRIGDWVVAQLEAMGATVDRRPDPKGKFADTIVGTISGRSGGPRVLLIGHMDTVFSEGEAAKRPFRIDGEVGAGAIARGPGVTDMKSGLIAGLRAVGAIVALGGEFPFEGLTFIANPDEEVGSPSSTPHIEEAAATADAAFVLECARASGDFVSARKGMADIKLTVAGRAAHAGVEPEKGRSAIVAGAELVRSIHALNGRWPDVTTNVGVFRAGTRPNIVCDDAELQVDVRAMSAEPLAKVLEAINMLALNPAVPDCNVRVETMARWAPMEKLERSGRLADHVIALASRLGFETKDVSTGGASDANTTSGMGVPSIDGLGPVGGLDHSPEEYLEVDSIVPRTALVAALLLEVARDPAINEWRADPRRTGPVPR